VFYSRFGEWRPQKIKENICAVSAPGRIGSRVESKSGNSCTYVPVGSPSILRGQKIKENMSGVLLALRTIGTGKDWSAHRVQEWQLVYVQVGCPTMVRGQKIKENMSGDLLALRRIEASKDKREYIWCLLALRRIEESEKKENICTVLAPGRIGSRIEFKSGNSRFGELRPHKRKENIICMYRNL
jgi:hypothetical protein